MDSSRTPANEVEKRRSMRNEGDDTSNQSHNYIYTSTRNCNQFDRCKRLWRPHTSSHVLHRQARETRSITSYPYLFATISSTSYLTRPQLLATIAWRCLSWMNVEQICGMGGIVLWSSSDALVVIFPLSFWFFVGLDLLMTSRPRASLRDISLWSLQGIWIYLLLLWYTLIAVSKPRERKNTRVFTICSDDIKKHPREQLRTYGMRSPTYLLTLGKDSFYGFLVWN